MHSFLAQTFTILLSFGIGDSLYSIDCESELFETAFDTNVHIEASVSYPRVPETTPLARYANEVIKKEARKLHDTFVQEMSTPEEELCEEDGDDRTLRYDLSLVQSDPDLISFYGSKYQYRGGAHGSVWYITKTFCQQDGIIQELSLDDIFLPGYREWLFQYCEGYFKSSRCGYYDDDDHSWVGFNPKDLDAFLLTEKGLLLLFQNYVVSGYDDCPMTLLIPYTKLSHILNPDSTFSVDHLWTTGIQKRAINDDSSRWMERGAFRYDFGELAAGKWCGCCGLITRRSLVQVQAAPNCWYGKSECRGSLQNSDLASKASFASSLYRMNHFFILET